MLTVAVLATGVGVSGTKGVKVGAGVGGMLLNPAQEVTNSRMALAQEKSRCFFTLPY